MGGWPRPRCWCGGFVTGTPPRRRALGIGAPIALLYFLLQATYQGLQLFTAANASAAAEPVKGVIDWAFARGTVGGLVRLPVRSGGGRIVRRARAGKDRAGIVAPTLLAEPERILREPPEATVGRFSPGD